jgi:hypothetical protein
MIINLMIYLISQRISLIINVNDQLLSAAVLQLLMTGLLNNQTIKQFSGLVIVSLKKVNSSTTKVSDPFIPGPKWRNCP